MLASHEQTHDLLASKYRIGVCGGLAAAIAVGDDVRGD
jgi:hypothetical protein